MNQPTFRPSTFNEMYSSSPSGAPAIPGQTNWKPILITTGIIVVGVIVIAIVVYNAQVASTKQIVKNLNYQHEEKLNEIQDQNLVVHSTLSELREQVEKINYAIESAEQMQKKKEEQSSEIKS